MTELYKKYRPKRFADLVGQASAVSQLKKWIEKKDVPHAMLFSGPSGVGKTTAAKIVAKRIGCGPSECIEMNAADCRGIDEIRAIDRTMRAQPMAGECKVWIVDECHQLTKTAQDSFLKPLEDTPETVYFILCSSKPMKMIEAVRTRTSEVSFKKIKSDVMQKLIESVLSAEKEKLEDSVIGKIIESAEGSARKALVMLQQVLTTDNEKEQINIIESASAGVVAFEICQILLYNPKWESVVKYLNKTEEDPEAIRRMILGYANKVCLNNPKFAGRANVIISFFRDHFFDCGAAGLTNACYELTHARD